MSDNGDQSDGPVDRHISLEEQLEEAHERIQLLENVEQNLTLQLHAQQHDLNRLQDELEDAQARVNQLQADLAQVQQQLADQDGQGRRRPTERTWYSKLHEGWEWNVVFKYAQGEENMSTRIDVRHPDVTFVDRTEAVLDFAEYQGGIEEPVSDAESLGNPESLMIESPVDDDASPPYDAISLDPEIEISRGPDFNDLPSNCLGRVLELVLFQKYKLVHCLSRLDSFDPLDRDARPPPDSEYFLGLHAFYGLNTFAFSSLGELGRFCTGINTHRVQRIQHIELLWQGNYFLVNERHMEKRRRGKMEAWRSKRTEKLDHLAEMKRLKTMVIFIDENRTRRIYEPNCVQDLHEKETRGHPNYRPLRNMRTLSGLDNVLELRGLSYVRLYDTSAGEESGGQRVPIWDWSFQEHVTRVVTQHKLPNRQAAAELTKLAPLFPVVGTNNDDDDLYTPTDDDMAVVLRWYSEETQGLNTGNVAPGDHDDEPPSDDTHSVSIPDSEDEMPLSEPDSDNHMNLDDTDSDDDIGGISDHASQHSSSDGDSSGDDSDDSRFHGVRQKQLKDLTSIQFGDSGSFVFKRESSTCSTFNFDIEGVRSRSLSPFMNPSAASSPLSLFRAESESMFVTPEPESGGVIDLTEDENESVATDIKRLFSVSSEEDTNGSVSTEAKRHFSVSSSEEDGDDGDGYSGRHKRFRTDSVIHSSQEEVDAERFASEPWN